MQSSTSASRPFALTALPVLLAALVPGLPGATAGAQATERVSVSTTGAEGDATSLNVSTSLDGRFVAFESLASNLCDADAGGQDVFVRDRQTDTTILVSEKAEAPGTAAAGASRSPQISQDGRLVTFWSTAPDLVSPSVSSVGRLWQRDLMTGQFAIVSIDSTGAPIAADVAFGASATGRWVAFVTGSSILPGDTNGHDDVFVRDMQTGSVVRASLTPSGGELDRDATLPSISRDGRWVAFETAATNLLQGTVSIYPQVYVKDLATGAVELVSATLAGDPSPNGARKAVIAGLGRHVAFEAANGALYAWPTNPGANMIYVRDLEDDVTWPASISPSGLPANNYCYAPAISDDGRYTAFQTTAANLDPLTVSNRYQIFVYDRSTNLATGVSKTPTNQPGSSNSTAPRLSGDGRYVVYESEATDLVPGDANAASDAFVHDRGLDEIFGYGVGKTNTLGCQPAMSTTGLPSASAGSGFLVDCDEVRNLKSGLLFYGVNGGATISFLGGVLYVAPPLKRTQLLFSGGSPSGNDCTGHFSFDFNVRIASGVDPWLAAGVAVNAQYWSRDPGDPAGTSLSDAIAFVIAP